LYHLLFSAYGRTLIAKVAVFAAVLAIGGYKRYWRVPKVAIPPRAAAPTQFLLGEHFQQGQVTQCLGTQALLSILFERGTTLRYLCDALDEAKIKTNPWQEVI